MKKRTYILIIVIWGLLIGFLIAEFNFQPLLVAFGIILALALVFFEKQIRGSL